MVIFNWYRHSHTQSFRNENHLLLLLHQGHKCNIFHPWAPCHHSPAASKSLSTSVWCQNVWYQISQTVARNITQKPSKYIVAQRLGWGTQGQESQPAMERWIRFTFFLWTFSFSFWNRDTCEHWAVCKRNWSIRCGQWRYDGSGPQLSSSFNFSQHQTLHDTLVITREIPHQRHTDGIQSETPATKKLGF